VSRAGEQVYDQGSIAVSSGFIQLPDHRAVTDYFHIFADPPERYPYKRIEPINGIQQRKQDVYDMVAMLIVH
jgi:hypothetical protein